MKPKKESWLVKSLSLLILVGLYLVTRLIKLTSLPVFADEAIYIRWSQIIKNVETLRFIPLTDGKQPLFMWVTVPFLSFFKDPLIAGRIVSVLAGLLSLILIFLITSIILYKPKILPKNPLTYILNSINYSYHISFIASFIYILLPYSFFFDRLATPDNMLVSFILLSTFLTVLQFKYYRLDLSLLLGISLGLAYLTKSPALYFMVLSSLFLSIHAIAKKNNSNLFIKLFFSFLPIIISLAMYNFLRLGPQFHMIALRNTDYVWPLSEILKHPLDPLKPHLLATLSVFVSYTSIPLLLIFCGGLFYALKNYKTLLSFDIIYILSVFFIPILATTSMAKVFTGRYILFSVPYFIILLTYNITHLKNPLFINRFLFIIVFLFIFLPNIIFINKLTFSPQKVNFPPTDTGYINDWTSGWGIINISQYLIDRAKISNVIVGTEGHFGSLPDGLQIYTNETPKLTIIGQGIGLTSIPPSLIEARNFGDEVYLLINSNRHSLDQSSIDKLVITNLYIRPDDSQLILYKLI